MSELFRAVLVDRRDGAMDCRVTSLPVDDLPEGDTLVRIAWSSLNYKDALAITGAGKILRSFPFVPGIDFAGHVVETGNGGHSPGDPVILTGWGVGERHWGGLAELARVRGEWLVPLPDGLTLRHAMTVGTAGLTAMLCVMALEEQGVTPQSGEVVVTGAAGGVGSIAMALLARSGYPVVAVTGRPELVGFLRELGAASVVDRSEILEVGKGPLGSQRWAGAVDVVGGEMLAALLKTVRYGGSVAACGLAGGAELHTTVFPFILRGVRLIGVDSVYCPRERRIEAWNRIARTLDAELLERLTTEIPLEQVCEVAPRFLKGQVRGRLVVRIGENG